MLKNKNLFKILNYKNNFTFKNKYFLKNKKIFN